jgi:hypothetical protein
MSDTVFIDDENLVELIRELRDGVASGRMKHSDAVDILAKAIKRFLGEKGVLIIKDQISN